MKLSFTKTGSGPDLARGYLVAIWRAPWVTALGCPGPTRLGEKESAEGLGLLVTVA